MSEDFNPAAPEQILAPEDTALASASTEAVQTEPTAPDQEKSAPAKPKTKAELEIENANLLAANAALMLEIATLRKALPNLVTAKPGHKVVFIKSNNVAAVPKNGKKYAEGSVNGVRFEVLCDTQIEVSDEIAEALAGVISNQS